MTCQIEIVNKIDAEGPAIERALKKVAQYYMAADQIKIICAPRVPADAEPYRHPGWLEYGIHIRFDNSSVLYLLMIQRSIGAEFEFHS